MLPIEDLPCISTTFSAEKKRAMAIGDIRGNRTIARIMVAARNVVNLEICNDRFDGRREVATSVYGAY